MSLTPTGQRSLSEQLLMSDAERALVVARGIEDPWFRCQALSTAGRVWREDAYEGLLKEAVKAADSQENAYQRVTVSAWPIRAYLERGNVKPAKRLLEKYTPDARNIENMGGRSEALLMLLQAARPFAPDLWQLVFWALVQATEPSLAWRQRRNIRIAIKMVAEDHAQLAHEALARLTDEKTIAGINRDLHAGHYVEPRSFF